MWAYWSPHTKPDLLAVEDDVQDTTTFCSLHANHLLVGVLVRRIQEPFLKKGRERQRLPNQPVGTPKEANETYTVARAVGCLRPKKPLGLAATRASQMPPHREALTKLPRLWSN
jgi:hypothetical protein